MISIFSSGRYTVLHPGLNVPFLNTHYTTHSCTEMILSRCALPTLWNSELGPDCSFDPTSKHPSTHSKEMSGTTSARKKKNFSFKICTECIPYVFCLPTYKMWSQYLQVERSGRTMFVLGIGNVDLWAPVLAVLPTNLLTFITYVPVSYLDNSKIVLHLLNFFASLQGYLKFAQKRLREPR